MRDPWLPENEPGGDDLEDLFALDREAWRGTVHLAREPWRGDEHLEDWPEHAAGPEYWMFKAMRGDV